MEQLNIIGVDPRGVGLSDKIKCDPATGNERVTAFPKTEEEFDKMVAHNEAVWESCKKLNGPLLGHVDTTSYVRNIEAVRVALVKEKLNFIGESYGSQVGFQYAELFPDNFRTVVLDRNLDHSQSLTAALVTETTTYETKLEHFFSWCSESKDCLLHGQNVTQIFVSLVVQADKDPIPAPGCYSSGACRPRVTGEDILFNRQPMLNFKNPLPPISAGWNTLALALQEASAGNATLRSTELATSEDSHIFCGPAVLCLDWTG